MKFDFKGSRTEENKIAEFIEFLTLLNDKNRWIHNGLIVEIDPTVDYRNNNILIRWKDIFEGFNDRLIYTNLVDFKKDFKLVNA